MESLLLLLIPLACPLVMGAVGVGAWMWAKARAVPAKLAGGPRAAPAALRRVIRLDGELRFHERAGFTIRFCRRFAFGPSALGLQVAHVIGTATRS